ncbi:carbohydrate esterase family 4 protein [Phanerochaete carnosa HHB-10118-sp]|uniref:chitin deacetylase n=1 Tax=Phanerochaete carnosa (strain HHB-10118-sp) TaxID=650164 RepID=K5WNR2_PHACS|nr:carbohydrate esterase family 4 protein [Phanerochaete carnosa HHB-10118-sp]EKM60819.1 carbohydrate esterase family 4 protein [Phanerochaete carnosa HHB-10118-sp]
MKLPVLAAAAAAALPTIAAHKPNLPRQGPASSGSAATSSTFSVPGYAPGVSVASSFSTLPTVSWSLPSVNPTAIPLSDIVPGTITTQSTLGATTTFPAGSTPTGIPNAPPMPNWQTLSPANYPALDKTPPTDSPQVQQWIQDVQNSGIAIPDFQPTQPGGCPANLELASNETLCWWTCTGCTASTDITTCPTKLTWGVTHDDGPSPYTPNLLQYYNQNDLTGTFFCIGSRVISYPAILQEEYMAGNQICAHTWSHPYMTTLTNEEIIAELGWSIKVIKDVLGVTPLCWRPPYGDVDNRVRAIATAMGLETIIWTRVSPTVTFDTGDFNIPGDTISPSQVLLNWENIMGNATIINTGFIVLEHDLFAQTVDMAVGYILPAALAFQPKLTLKPVIECLGFTLADGYLETNDNTTHPLPTSSFSNAPSATGAAGSAQASASGNASGGTTNPTGGAASVATNNALLAAGTAAAAILAALGTLL